MLKYISKIFIILCLFSIVSLYLLFVNAEPNDETLPEDTTTSETDTSTEQTDEDQESETNEDTEISEESSDDIHTENTQEPIGQVQPSSTDNMNITSVKNINGLPEANLELNNILNIILIAIGVLLILLSIALLIRLKK